MNYYESDITYSIDRNGINRSRWFSVIVAFFLVTSVYLIPFATSLSFGEVLLIISILALTFFKRKVAYYNDSVLWIFVIYSIVISLCIPLVSGVSASGAVSRLVRDGFYFVSIYIFGYTFVDYKVLRRWITRICIALSVLVIAQFVGYFMFGILIPGILPGSVVAETNTLLEIYQHALVSAGRNGYLKAMGFLTEGAHCGQALAIGMVALFNFDKPDNVTRKEYLTVILFSIAGVLTFSASGLFLVVAVWVGIIWSLIKSGLTSKRIGMLLLLLLVFICAFLFSSGDLNVMSVIGRITSATSMSTADNSSFYRIYKGLAFWIGLPIENKILGIGFGNYTSLSFLVSGINQDYLISEYMNSFSYILVSGGIIGFVLYAFHIVKLLKNGNCTARTMIMILLLMSVSSSPYSSVYWVWMVLIAIFNNRNIQNEEVMYSGQ